ncbi:hypothetical protein ACFL47_08955 [Candidatus Latescibacterota bacterium]
MRHELTIGTRTAIFVIALLLLLPLAVYAADDFTDADAKALISDDPDAAADVLYKLQDIFSEKGKDGLKTAVPHLIAATERELGLPEDARWNLVDIVKIISLTGDERVKPMLLRIMSVMWGGGNPFVAQGLLSIGHSTLADVVDSLKSTSPDTKGRAAITLHKMNQGDDSKAFFTSDDREKIKKGLLANLKDENVQVRIYTVMAMRSFGDNSVFSALEHIEKHDAHKDSGGTYEVRLEASETLKHLKAK